MTATPNRLEPSLYTIYYVLILVFTAGRGAEHCTVLHVSVLTLFEPNQYDIKHASLPKDCSQIISAA